MLSNSNKGLLLTLVSVMSYVANLNGDFVFDDSEAVYKNEDVISKPWSDAFYNDFWGTNIKSNLSHKSYRPLTILSFKLHTVLDDGKLVALHFKVANLICHVICCLLVWRSYEKILEIMSRKPNPSLFWFKDEAFIAALLFAVHPIHSEAISGIVGRADLLAGVTFFLAFLCYAKRKKRPVLYLILTLVLSATSMLCKENGITVLGFCVMYEFATLRCNNKSIHSFDKNRIIRLISLVATAGFLLYTRWLIMGGEKPTFKPIDNPAAFSESLFTKIVTYNYIYAINVVLLIWPQWLCYDWSMGCITLIKSMFDLRITLIIVMYSYGLIIIKNIYKSAFSDQQRVIFLAISLIVIPFLPASNILFPVGFVLAERILYIPSAGYCLLVTVGLNKLFRKYEKNKLSSTLIKTLYTSLLISYSLKSWQRSGQWKNEYNLFLSALNVCPMNAKVHYNAAKSFDAKNEKDWAIAEYEEAIRLYPEYYQAMNNLANILKDKKMFKDAESYLLKAIKVKPDFAAAWMNLGIVWANTGKYTESENAYKTALKYRKKYPDCMYNLGNLYLEINNTESALTSWSRTIDMNPKHVLAWTNLLALLDNSGLLEKALELIPLVVSELPNEPTICFSIANIYGKIGLYEEAEEYFKRTISLLGDKVKALHYSNFGVLYHRWKKYTSAEQMYMKALEYDPSFKSAQKNLRLIKSELSIK